MAYYCLAVVVSKSAVSQVELQAVEGGFSERRLTPIVFSITAKEPSNGMHPTANSAAFMRETRMVSRLNARRVMPGVGRLRGTLPSGRNK